MRKISFAVMLVAALVLLTGCGGAYPGLPNLPMKDWLDPDRDKKPPKSEKLEIYSPEKVMTFDDLVWLAVQDSPVLSKSMVGFEIREIEKRTEQWRYLPSINLNYTLSNNITRYNEAEAAKNPNYDTYGESQYQVTFGGNYRNPISTYLSVKAKDELINVAVATHRKAIAEVITSLATSLLRLDELEETIKILENARTNAKQQLEFSKVVQKHQVQSPWTSPTVAEETVSGIDLRIREAEMARVVERTKIKQVVGLDLQKALNVDTKSVYPLLNAFDPKKLDWKKCWESTEDRYLLHEQVRLGMANILISLAQYLPSINVGINESPPKGQSQPDAWQTDEFLHLTFSFPILDWGERFRTAQIHNVMRRQAKIEEIIRERAYEQNWMRLEQELELAGLRVENSEKIQINRRLREKSAEELLNAGALNMWNLADIRQNALEGRIARVNAGNRLANAKLAMMAFSNELAQHFLGPLPK